MTPTAPGSYTYFVDIVSAAGCLQQDSINVVVASAYTPDVQAIVSDSSIICGDTINFDVDLGGGIPATCGPSLTTACSAPATSIDVGTATGANTTTTWPAPYGNWYRNARHQFLFTAAELNAMGFIGGKITEISWEVTAINGTTTYNAYQIYMGCTPTTSLTNWETGLTQVMAPQNITISTGWNTHQLTTAYEWDGVSNLVVEICYDNLAVTYTNNSITPYTTTTFNSCLYYFSDSQPACPATTSTTSTNRPITRFTTCPTVPDPNNYTFQWTPNTWLDNAAIQTPTGTPLQTTQYLVTVTDINGGCTDTSSVLVNVSCGTCYAPIPELHDPICFGDSTGWIVATPVIVQGPVTMTWTDQGTGNVLQTTNNLTVNDTLTGLPAGTYLISTIDTAGCIADTLVTLVDPLETAISVSNDTIVCIGGTATISAVGSDGNGGPYTLTWDNGLVGNGPHQVSPIANTCYVVYAEDINGCISPNDTVCVGINPPMIGSTSGNDSICPGAQATISASVIGGSGTGYTYTWDDGTGTVGTGASITVTPTGAQTTYCVTITDDCETPPVTECLVIDWYANPVPAFAADITADCFPVDVNFTNTTPAGSVGTVVWDFGDANGNTATGNGGANFNYDLPGCYDVTLTVTSPEGCTVDTTYPNFICAYGFPIADFTFGPQPTTVLAPEINFTNTSTDNMLNYWEFDNGAGTSELENPSYVFPSNEPGSYDVMLVVTNEYGCVDTAYNTVVINGEYVIYVPNSFTPNGDGLNDIFLPLGEGISMEGYYFSIYDRWGNRIFETEDLNEGWDGTLKGSVQAPIDVYVWKLESKNFWNGEKQEHIGHVTLVR